MSTKREPLAETRMSEMLDLPHPYLLFLGDTTEAGYAKTAFGLRDWAADRCVGEWSCEGATVTTGLPRLSPKEARARGARALVIGVANVGGMIAESWMPSLLDALDSGLDIISGMHTKLNDTPQLKSAAERRGRRLIDVRTPPRISRYRRAANEPASVCSRWAPTAHWGRNIPLCHWRGRLANAAWTPIFARPGRPAS